MAVHYFRAQDDEFFSMKYSLIPQGQFYRSRGMEPFSSNNIRDQVPTIGLHIHLSLLPSAQLMPLVCIYIT